MVACQEFFFDCAARGIIAYVAKRLHVSILLHLERVMDVEKQIQNLQKRLARVQKQLEFNELIFNHIYNGACVTDARGIITHFNEPYGLFVGVDPKEQIGRHVTDVIQNTRMHVVARTGKAEINVTQRIKGQDMVVQRIPIVKDGRVIGVFGQVTFKDVRDLGRLVQRLSLLESKVRLYEEELSSLRSTRYTLESIKGSSPVMRQLKAEALRVAQGLTPVLITGESGTGKELFAQGIHQSSPRRMKPFVRLNCAAIPKDLFESELFGYAKGAFTGARAQGKPGKFELAHGGTIFLDEIGEMPLDMQPKLLRVLEEKEIERIGGTRVTKADFRLIAATNRNLEQLIEQGLFRGDLYYRLNVIPLQIPPLRQRPEDIMDLAESFLADMGRESGAAYELDASARTLLLAHHWPGNGRELYNVLERAVSSAAGNSIGADDLPFYLQRTRHGAAGGGGLNLRQRLRDAEKQALDDALEAANGNKAQAARLLGIHRTLLYKKLAKHGITRTPDSV